MMSQHSPASEAAIFAFEDSLCLKGERDSSEITLQLTLKLPGRAAGAFAAPLDWILSRSFVATGCSDQIGH